MNDDYLWDRSGAPDPEVQRLESLLSEFRHVERPLVLPADLPAAEDGLSFAHLLRKGRGIPWFPRFAAAAVVLLVLGFGIFLVFRPTDKLKAGTPWVVSNLEGTARIGSRTISSGAGTTNLFVGQTLTTGSASRVSLWENDLGEIRVEPNSRVRLLQSGPDRKRIQLDVGTIHAAIWAPPTQFVVDTPSATAVDLGCAYTLQVAPDGSGTIRTTLGWVGFHLHGRDSFIPAGAMCFTRPGIGPGTPCFEDASASFREALQAFDLAGPSAGAGSAALDKILSEARPRDGLTLWHLLSRTFGGERARIYDRLAAMIPPPAGVTREGILQLDPHMLDLYWNTLGLGDISIWRFWEQSSTPNALPGPATPQKKQSLLKKSP